MSASSARRLTAHALVAAACAIGSLHGLRAQTGATTGAAAQGEPQVMGWSIRATDLPSNPADPDRWRLATILATASDREYRVAAGDTLERVLSNQLGVSNRFPIAFRMYVTEVLNRNQGLRPEKLAPASTLLLPAGPRFASVQVGDLPPEIVTELTKDANIRTTATASTSVIPMGPSIAQHHPLLGVELVPQDPRRAEGSVAARAVAMNAFLPALTNARADCSGGCIACRELLGLPSSASTLAAPLLVADSGVDPAALDDLGRAIFPASGNVADLDPDRHGTFVYSEAVRSLNGVVPDDRVYVANVAVTDTDGKVGYSVARLRLAFVSMSALVHAEWVRDKSRPVTAVINVSAAGKSGGEGWPVLEDPRLLVVAAAGNDGSPTTPEQNIFARLNQPWSRLLVVGALDESSEPRIATYSNRHPEVIDLFARGSCVCGAGQTQLNGTSQAAPVVASAAAIVAGVFPRWEPLDVKWRLISTSRLTPALAGKGVGGILDLQRALHNEAIIAEVRDAGGEREEYARRLTFEAAGADDWRQVFVRDDHGGEGPAVPLLRITREKCPFNLPGTVCFRRLWLGRRPDLAAIRADASIGLASGVLKTSYAAKDIVDLIFPIGSVIASDGVNVF